MESEPPQDWGADRTLRAGVAVLGDREGLPSSPRPDSKEVTRDHAFISPTFTKVCAKSGHLLTVSVETRLLSFKYTFYEDHICPLANTIAS